jgi:hypothetical protein
VYIAGPGYVGSKVRATVKNKIIFAANHSLLAAQPVFLTNKLHNVENMI